MSVILVVEDDLLNLEMFKSLLSLTGHEVITAVTAEEALVLTRQYHPALILMDWRLPGGMDGIEATKIIKSDPKTAHIPVIMTTAHKQNGDEEHAFAAGCEGFIQKPVNMQALKQLIGSRLGGA